MPGFSDIIFELRTGLDDPDDLHMRLREVLDPDLADRLAGFGAARGMALSETILRAVELFMLSAAEDAWRQMSGAERDASLGDPALRVILEQFLSMSLDPPQQGQIAGPGPETPLNRFRRMA